MQGAKYVISNEVTGNLCSSGGHVFLRDYRDDNRDMAARFSAIQWAAFVQNLMIFDEAR